MTDIIISRLCLYGYHGVLPQEQQVGANFYFSLRAKVACSPAALQGDELEGTVSYADICEVIRQENAKRARLLEHLAYRTLRALLDTFPLMQQATLRVDKENPPMGIQADAVGIEMSLSRNI